MLTHGISALLGARTRKFREDASRTLVGLVRERRSDPIASWAAILPALAALESGDLRAEAARQLADPELRPLLTRLLESGGARERALALEALATVSGPTPN